MPLAALTRTLSRASLTGVLAAALLLAGPHSRAAAATGGAEATIRAALEDWTAAFNARRSERICELFARELRYDYRGLPERGYEEICALLRRSLGDPGKRFHYGLAISEIIVEGDLAVVRLAWTLTMGREGEPPASVTVERGMDIFRRQPDGSWKIVRYIAYEE